MKSPVPSESRSRNMAAIKSKDTKPELAVRSLLHALGYRFRLHRADLPGNPDVVLPRYRTVIFVNGCFWHRHQNCQYASTPKSNAQFWREKFAANVERDRRAIEVLEQAGWRVVVVWECEIANEEQLAKKLVSILSGEGE